MSGSRTGPFHALDDYESRHLVAHLVAGGDALRLRRLLFVTDARGKHGWTAHKRAVGQDRGLFDDLDLAADAAVVAGDLESGIAYSLMRASVTGISNRAPIELTVARVNAGATSLPAAIAVSRERPDIDERVSLLGRLSEVALNRGDEESAGTASAGVLSTVREAGPSTDTMIGFEHVVGQLAPSTLPEAVEFARDAEEPAHGARLLRMMADRLATDDPLRTSWLDGSASLARRSHDPLRRALALAELGAVVVDDRRALGEEAIAAAMEDDDEHYRARVVGQMAGMLAPELLPSLWRIVQGWPAWILEGGRWMAREHAVAGIAPAAAAAGLVELAVDAAEAIEEAGWYAESQLALLQTAAALPPPGDARVLRMLVDAVTAPPNLDEWGPLLRTAVEQGRAAEVAAEVARAYADKADDFWRQPTEGFSARWQIQSEVVERALAGSGPPDERPLAGEEVARRVTAAAPAEAAMIALAAARRLDREACRRVLDLAADHFEANDDADALAEMANALGGAPTPEPPIVLDAAAWPARGDEVPDDALLREFASARALPSREEKYDWPSAQESALQELLPRLLDAGMFSVYVDAAAAMPQKFSSTRAGSLMELVDAGAVEVALGAFRRLGGWAYPPVLAVTAERLPDRLWPRWLACLREVPAETRQEPIQAAGRRLLPPPILEDLATLALAITGSEARHAALGGLLPSWSATDAETAIRLHRALLRSSRRLSRPQLARDLAAVAPVLGPLLSREDLEGVRATQAAVQQWWP